MGMPTSRAEAIERGEPKYITGEACIKGHKTYRYTVTGECASCRTERNYKARQKDSNAYRAAKARREAAEKAGGNAP
jgi:hypothetical protein